MLLCMFVSSLVVVLSAVHYGHLLKMHIVCCTCDADGWILILLPLGSINTHAVPTNNKRSSCSLHSVLCASGRRRRRHMWVICHICVTNKTAIITLSLGYVGECMHINTIGPVSLLGIKAIDIWIHMANVTSTLIKKNRPPRSPTQSHPHENQEPSKKKSGRRGSWTLFVIAWSFLFCCCWIQPTTSYRT